MKSGCTRFAGLALLLAALLCLCAAALAEDSIRVSSISDPQSAAAGQTVNITIKVLNSSSSDAGDKITLYDPEGNSVTSYDSLKSEQSVTYNGTWTVTQEQLDKGKISYYIRFTENGELVTRSIPVTVQEAAAAPVLSANYTVSPVSARVGQTVKFSYTLSNTGNVELTNIVVSNPACAENLTCASIPAGQQVTLETSIVMGDKEVTSAPVITYQAAGDKQVYTLSDLVTRTLTIAKDGLEVSAAAKDSSPVTAGSSAELDITLKNTGNETYSDIEVRLDDGTAVASGITLAPGKEWSGTASVLVTGDMNVTASASCMDSAGEAFTVSSDPVALSAVNADKALVLSINAQARETVIHEEPAVVRFGVIVRNLGQTDAVDLSITEAGTKVASIASLPSGESKTIVFDLQTSIAGKFQFVVSGKDAEGNDQSFESEVITVAYVAPTPVPTPVPTPTPTPSPVPPTPTPSPTPTIVETISQYVDPTLLFGGIGIVIAVIVAVAAVGAVSEAKRKKRLAGAIDELEITSDRRHPNRRHKGPLPEKAAQPEKKEPEKKEPEKKDATAEHAKETAEKVKAAKAGFGASFLKKTEKPAAPTIVPTQELTEEVVRQERMRAQEEIRRRRNAEPQDLTTGETLRVMPADQRPEFTEHRKVDSSETKIFGKQSMVMSPTAGMADTVTHAPAAKTGDTNVMKPISEKPAAEAMGDTRAMSTAGLKEALKEAEKEKKTAKDEKKPDAVPAGKKRSEIKPMKKKHSFFRKSTDSDLIEDDEEDLEGDDLLDDDDLDD